MNRQPIAQYIVFKSIAAVAAVLLLAVTGCIPEDDQDQPDDPPQTFLTEAEIDELLANYRPWPDCEPDRDRMRRLAEGNNAFACEMYAQLVEGTDGNLTYSPFSISSALAMVYAGTRGNTKDQLRQAMHFELDDGELVKAFGDQCYRWDEILDEFPFQGISGGIEGIFVANSIWVDSSVALDPDYEKLITEGFNGCIKGVEFGDPVVTTRTINDWIAGQTMNKIQQALSPGDLAGPSVMALVNCLSLDLGWPRNTDFMVENEPFFMDRQTQVEVPMLKLTANRSAAVTDTFTAIDLGLGGSSISLMMILPHDIEGLGQVEPGFTAELLAEIDEHLTTTEVEMTFPEFEVRNKLYLIPMLKDLGITDAFGPAADLSGIGTSDAGELYISNVIQEAYTEVNEEGVGAAAVTIVAHTAKCSFEIVPEKICFTADHPYIFLIQDRSTQATLFMGRIVDPR